MVNKETIEMFEKAGYRLRSPDRVDKDSNIVTRNWDDLSPEDKERYIKAEEQRDTFLSDEKVRALIKEYGKSAVHAAVDYFWDILDTVEVLESIFDEVYFGEYDSFQDVVIDCMIDDYDEKWAARDVLNKYANDISFNKIWNDEFDHFNIALTKNNKWFLFRNKDETIKELNK